MADVRLSIVGREYIVTCRDGEEQRLTALGRLVDEKAREAGGSSGGLNESRQLLFASLLLADQLYDAQENGGTAAARPATGLPADVAEQMALSVERLAERIETLAQTLEQQA